MEVESLKKGKSNYLVSINGNEYEFDEEVIIEFRLVVGKELDESTLESAINKNVLIKHYKNALNYSVKYAKSKSATKDYLIGKGLSFSEASIIVDELEAKGIINDSLLIEGMIYSLTKSGNGRLLIKNKLYEKGFSKQMIDESIEKIDSEQYYIALNKLYEKSLIKYKKELNDYIKKGKIRRFLSSKGYLSYEIDEVVK